MTQYRIAKDAGIPQPTISRIRHGQADCMSSTLKKLEALCVSAGIDLESVTPAPQDQSAA